MEKDFDFDRIGKRMPYRTPAGFFDEMEARLQQEVQPNRPAQTARRRTFRLSAIAGITAIAAASITLLFYFQPFAQDNPSDGLHKVEQAFANLSTEDQAYLLEVYQDDLFIMNENE